MCLVKVTRSPHRTKTPPGGQAPQFENLCTILTDLPQLPHVYKYVTLLERFYMFLCNQRLSFAYKLCSSVIKRNNDIMIYTAIILSADYDNSSINSITII
jgi:hypothetical protein